jgi:prepilin-type N-terminal cleavage/methylation domain-containing protein
MLSHPNTARYLVKVGKLRQRGLSLVELMVGIAVGLFVVAAASLVVSSQLNDNRKLLLELQVQQDLRATADIISRELRRAAYWDVSQAGVVNSAIDPLVEPVQNPNRVVLVSGGAAQVTYKYKRLNSEEGPFAFDLTTNGVIRTNLTSQSGFQELTDVNTLVVDVFNIVQNQSAPVTLPCPKDCLVGTASSCWPTISVREYTVTITGHAPSDPAITRTVVTQVRLRNDVVTFAAGSVSACPV